MDHCVAAIHATPNRLGVTDVASHELRTLREDGRFMPGENHDIVARAGKPLRCGDTEGAGSTGYQDASIGAHSLWPA
jgi:hypothetical protein